MHGPAGAFLIENASAHHGPTGLVIVRFRWIDYGNPDVFTTFQQARGRR